MCDYYSLERGCDAFCEAFGASLTGEDDAGANRLPECKAAEIGGNGG